MQKQTQKKQKSNTSSQNNNNNQSNNQRQDFDPSSWTPVTELGRQVKSGEIKHVDEILGSGKRILEPEIIDTLMKTESELLLIGQAKGKFGGGQRRVFRQTQKKTREGNKPKFATFAVVGDKNGHVGVGYGKSKETVPAREKSFAQAKLNMIVVRRGTGSWEDQSTEPHSIPFAVEGSCGSYRIKLMPAPKGKGLICDKEVAKILEMAGIKNVWSKSFGQTKNKVNVIKATMQALKRLNQVSIHESHKAQFAIVDGSVAKSSRSTSVEESSDVKEVKEEKPAVKKAAKKPTKKSEVKKDE